MNNFQRIIIAVILGVGTVFGLQWIGINWFGATQEQIEGVGGIGLIVVGIVVIIGFLKITEKRDDEES